MKKLIVLMLSFRLCSALIFNEIMYNPEGDDNNREYIELYLEHPASLDGWIFAESDSNDTLELLELSDSPYALLVEEGFNCSGINASVYTAGSSIGNGLGNSGDSISIYNANGTLMAQSSFDAALANSNGKSLQLCNGSWIEAEPTPGSMNACVPEALDNDTPDDIASPNETIEQNSSDSVSQCPGVSVAADRLFYEDGDKVSIRHKTDSTDEIEYWIEDIEGKVVKQKQVTSNTNAKSWTPHIDQRLAAFYLKARLAQCSETAEALILVRNPEFEEEEIDEPEEDSSVSIEDLTLSGKAVNTRLSIYKGNTQKSSVQLYAEDSDGKAVSPVARISIPKKYQSLDLTLSLPLDGCGSATIIAEGLDDKDSRDIKLKACPELSQDQPETNRPLQDKALPQVFIKSFYTLSKKYKENIPVYANLDLHNETGMLAVIESQQGIMETEAVQGKQAFNVSVKPGRNTISLQLMMDGEIIESKTLVAELEGTLAAIEPVEVHGQHNQTATSAVVREQVYDSSHRSIAGIIIAACLVPLGILGYRWKLAKIWKKRDKKKR